MKLSADFRQITCSHCKQHPGYTQALYDFEIGEYSWPAWLDRYAVKNPCNEIPLQNTYPAIGWDDHIKKQKAEAAERKALLAKFEARKKRD